MEKEKKTHSFDIRTFYSCFTAFLLLASVGLLNSRVEAQRNARPLPAFTGTTLDGSTLSVGSLIGKRLLLFTFNASSLEAKAAARALSKISEFREEHNFQILGAGRGGAALYELQDKWKFDFQILEDSRMNFASKLGAKSPAAFLVVNSSGKLIRGGDVHTGGLNEELAAERIENMLKGWLRLPKEEAFGMSSFGGKPLAPNFVATTLDGSNTFSLHEAGGRGTVIVFFLHTCPHCHHALSFFKKELAKIPLKQRPNFIGISVQGNLKNVTRSLEKYDIDFFKPYRDPSKKIQQSFGDLSSYPTSFIIDPENRLISREEGWNPRRHPHLLRMRIAQISGMSVPMLLNSKGFSGNEFCGTCHDNQHDTWALTTHARAFETLIKHGAESDPNCVGCHVVGWEQTGGYSLERPTSHLEGVGCESCHGRGGPHLSPDFVKNDNYETVCLNCHDSKHSLGFDYKTFALKTSHKSNTQYLSLTDEEKLKLVLSRKKARNTLPENGATYVGSDACRDCHSSEYQIWSQQAHALSTQSLGDQKENSDCLKCHTTGFGSPGGFPVNAALSDDMDLGRVGCESCHGPGSVHIANGSKKKESILALTDKCGSCVILEICSGCHDDANDPGFEFEVKEKIEKQRHGGLPLPPLGNKPLFPTTDSKDVELREFHNFHSLLELRNATEKNEN
tara:strand:- start:627 stop:2660 length:2034 start_codon:yes stop_codon:yes gene_type:complete